MHSVVQKLPEVSNLLMEHGVKIAGITESWASADLKDAELQVDNFNVYRKDKLTMTSFATALGFLSTRQIFESSPIFFSHSFIL